MNTIQYPKRTEFNSFSSHCLKRILITLTVFLIGSHYSLANVFKEDGLYYTTLDNQNVAVYPVYYEPDRYKGDIIIPETVIHNDSVFKVVAIDPYAFKHSYITSVSIPSCVTSIGAEAFFGCRSLTEITLPPFLEELGKDALVYCPALESITIDAANNYLTTIDGILYNKDVTELIVVPGGRTELSNLPTTVKKIKTYACYDSNLTKVIFPVGLEEIEERAFYCDWYLEEIEFSNTITKIGKEAFSLCTSLKKVDLPESLIDLEGAVFAECSSLESASFPDSITYIPDGTFYKCEALTRVKFPSALETLGIGVFSECDALTQMELPDNLTTIPSNLFYYCRHLKNIKLPSALTSIESGAFSGCYELAEINLPFNLRKIGEFAFSQCHSLKNITIPANVNELYAKSFTNCTDLENFYVDNDNIYFTARNGILYDKGMAVLLSCPDTKVSVTDIPSTVKLIGSYAFSDCVNLKEIYLPESVKEIGDHAFAFCEALPNIRLPESLEYIGNWAFRNNYSLESIYIPENVLFIGFEAFMSVNNMSQVVCGATNPPLLRHNKSFFLPDYAILYVPDFNVDIYKSTEGWNVFEHILPFGEENYPSSFSIVNVPSQLNAGDSWQLYTQILPYDAVGSEIIWESSDETVAFVNDYGLVSCITEGKATITAVLPGFLNTIYDRPVLSSSIEIEIGNSSSNITDVPLNDREILHVYTIQGHHLLSTKNREDLNILKSGLYIINGKKHLIR